MDMQNLPKSESSVARLSTVVEELIAVVQKQRADLSAALEAEKNKTAASVAQINALEEQNKQLSEELNAAKNNTAAESKIKELEDLAENRNNKISGLQTEVQNLNTALANRKAQLEEVEQKNAELVQKLAQMQQTIAQTTENIDDVVAKLEKVLNENGASNNNN